MDENQIEEMLNQWHYRIEANQTAYNYAAQYYRRRHYLVGLPVVVLTGIIGTAIFTNLQDNPGLILRIVMGTLSVAAAIFSGIQTFFKYGELSEKYRRGSVEFGAIRRQIEQALATFDDVAELKTMSDEIRKHIDDAVKEIPELPVHIFRKSETSANSKTENREVITEKHSKYQGELPPDMPVDPPPPPPADADG